MSVSCVGTCSACGVRRLWLSNTFSLQLDDGSLKCLRHPGEDGDCEDEGLTLAQAAERGRLFRETFYVCRHCGRLGEFIERREYRESKVGGSVWADTKLMLAAGAVMVPVVVWLEWWTCLLALAIALPVVPLSTWRENRKRAAENAAKGLPRADAPGRTKVGPPTRGIFPDAVIGRKLADTDHGPTATGPCCDRPNWKWAGSERDEDRIPCCACGRGVMTVSDHAIH